VISTPSERSTKKRTAEGDVSRAGGGGESAGEIVVPYTATPRANNENISGSNRTPSLVRVLPRPHALLVEPGAGSATGPSHPRVSGRLIPFRPAPPTKVRPRCQDEARRHASGQCRALRGMTRARHDAHRPWASPIGAGQRGVRDAMSSQRHLVASVALVALRKIA
jgi:hypothetical protein